MLTVIAEIRTRPGQHHRQAVLDQFVKIIPTVLKEEGCHGYAPMVDAATDASFQATAPDSIIMVEQWETVAHLEAHLQTAHMKAWSDAVKGDVLETHIRILEQGVYVPPTPPSPTGRGRTEPGPVSVSATGFFYQLKTQLLCLF